MFKSKHFIFSATQFYVVHKLIQKSGREMKRKYIYCFMLATAVLSGHFAAICTTFFKAIFVATDAETQFKKIFAGIFFVVMIYHHARIITCPSLIGIIPAN